MRARALLGLVFLVSPAFGQAEIPPPPPPGIAVPDWALPQSPTHKQVPPPAGFHRPAVLFSDKIGAFDAQADIGGPLVPGDAVFNAPTGTYTISSAGYNIWYQRDEFRFLWKKMSGDMSLAASVTGSSASFASTKITVAPRRCRYSAMARPEMPRPYTATRFLPRSALAASMLRSIAVSENQLVIAVSTS